MYIPFNNFAFRARIIFHEDFVTIKLIQCIIHIYNYKGVVMGKIVVNVLPYINIGLGSHHIYMIWSKVSSYKIIRM